MTSRSSRRWTSEDLSLLRRLAYTEPLSAIAAALDRSPLAVRTKAAHERLPLEDDVKGAGSALTARRAPIGRDASASQPRPADYVVIYHPRTFAGNPRLELVRFSEIGSPTLIRATFTSAEEAGPRFEDAARAMANTSGSQAFRCVDGEYVALTADDPDT